MAPGCLRWSHYLGRSLQNVIGGIGPWGGWVGVRVVKIVLPCFKMDECLSLWREKWHWISLPTIHWISSPDWHWIWPSESCGFHLEWRCPGTIGRGQLLPPNWHGFNLASGAEHNTGFSLFYLSPSKQTNKETNTNTKTKTIDMDSIWPAERNTT